MRKRIIKAMDHFSISPILRFSTQKNRSFFWVRKPRKCGNMTGVEVKNAVGYGNIRLR